MGTAKDEGGEDGEGRRASGVKSREPAGPAEAVSRGQGRSRRPGCLEKPARGRGMESLSTKKTRARRGEGAREAGRQAYL